MGVENYNFPGTSSRLLYHKVQNSIFRGLPNLSNVHIFWKHVTGLILFKFENVKTHLGDFWPKIWLVPSKNKFCPKFGQKILKNGQNLTFSQNPLSWFNGARKYKIQAILVLKPELGGIVFCLNRFIAQRNRD